jgi:hypothetical protein
MATRIQVIMDEKEAAMFRNQAKKETVSLSRWIRDAARQRLENERLERSLKDPYQLDRFFKECDQLEQDGVEPDWTAYKKLLKEGYTKGVLA